MTSRLDVRGPGGSSGTFVSQPVGAQVMVDLLASSIAHVGTWTYTHDASGPRCDYMLSDATQNDALSFDAFLAAGTWSMDLFHYAASNRAVYTVKIDGVTVGTIDGNNVTAADTRSTLTGIPIPTTGIHTIQLVMATTTSGNWYGSVSAMTFTRTA